MKKVKRDDLRTEYRREDLGKGVRGKYLKAYRAGTNLVLLEPEIAAAFPTDRAVKKGTPKVSRWLTRPLGRQQYR